MAIRTWLARSSSISLVRRRRTLPGGRRSRQFLEALLLRRELAGHPLVTVVELVAHLEELVAELGRELLQPEAEPLVIPELAGVEAVHPLGQAPDQVVDFDERRAWLRRSERCCARSPGGGGGPALAVSVSTWRCSSAIDSVVRRRKLMGEEGLPPARPGDTVLTPTRRGVEQSGSSSGS